MSHNKCSETYCGPEAFSEPETKNIRDFVQTLDPVPVLGHCFHSYSQFPVRLAFAMTINKAQGQTLGRVGVCLNSPCFSHVQFHVAASRVGHPDNIKFAVVPDER